MSSNVGLSTPRGSGTSGYVQRNLSLLKPRDSKYGPPPGFDEDKPSFRQRQPDKQILEHDRRRAIEVQIVEERDRLEEENEKIDLQKENAGTQKLSEEDIEKKLDELRATLTKQLEEGLEGGSRQGPVRDGRQRDRPGYEPYPSKDKRRPADGPRNQGRKQFKPHQVHELAEAKIEESERLRKALGIRGDGERDQGRSGNRDRRASGRTDDDRPRERGSRW
ncbi:RNA-splicing factor [Myotisia sp. PD_48]|nr:RNA-splicing factor [Myotisia sp. PD_48]